MRVIRDSTRGAHLIVSSALGKTISGYSTGELKKSHISDIPRKSKLII
jgi:hypothetical protein